MRVLTVVIALAISVASLDVYAARPGQDELASLSGTASDSSGHALANANVQLRNVSTGQLVGNATTNGTGQFSFPSLPAGSYLVEVVDQSGQILATSGSVVVSPGWAVSGVSVTSYKETTAAPATHRMLTSPHAMIIMGAAAAAGIGVAMAAGGTASASQ
jgi:carboxypeptidase family protein